MSVQPVKTRFAPSPTGLLHLGNVRTALFNALLARHHGGIFLLRIEDTDLRRSQRGAIDALIEDLGWLGMVWQEGPGKEAGAGPYRQSERQSLYNRYIVQLNDQGLAYPCFCSAEELAALRQKQLAQGKAPRYPGTCARLSEAEIAARLQQGGEPSLRFRVPQSETIAFDDLVRGRQRFATDDIGDFIIRRANGAAAFFFSNALDDALMGITHVLRGEDHVSNTPRQIMLLNALKLKVPRYGHIALVLGDDSVPLSKRHGSHSVRALRERGYLPMAINNALARLGHYYKEAGYMDFKQLAAGFSTNRLSRASARFDLTQLDHWQRETLVQAGADEILRWMGREVYDRVPEGARAAFVDAVRANILFPQDALVWARITYGAELEITAAASTVLRKAGRDFCRHALDALLHNPHDYQAFVAELQKKSSLRGKALFAPLRAALTGRADGPELKALFPLMGPERVRSRLEMSI
ncbi:MAG: glutamate--tRNA ligase [Gammaproteobacteria bacterium]|nr:glutamate--tRNA ligase [Gammaproteobacteria bacterium]MCI0591733.1 glutamate--tRNA ligase [Gammaproteobacteria bacterium]